MFPALFDVACCGRQHVRQHKVAGVWKWRMFRCVHGADISKSVVRGTNKFSWQTWSTRLAQQQNSGANVCVDASTEDAKCINDDTTISTNNMC
mmetsp:Transcript_28445/g.75971  ORF Transcript_28445/g.75971 Transcript_28445/m.75971 type:complete len:93 (+) Transcript_28445:141-419(+)